MYNTPITRMLCVLDGYLEIIDSYRLNFVMDINQSLHLACKESGLCVQRYPESLHNFKSEPHQAHQIVTHLRNKLRRETIGRKDVQTLEALLRRDAIDVYHKGSDELLFSGLVISRMIELAEDDEQFSEFSHF